MGWGGQSYLPRHAVFRGPYMQTVRADEYIVPWQAGMPALLKDHSPRRNADLRRHLVNLSGLERDAVLADVGGLNADEPGPVLRPDVGQLRRPLDGRVPHYSVLRAGLVDD